MAYVFGGTLSLYTLLLGLLAAMWSTADSTQCSYMYIQ